MVYRQHGHNPSDVEIEQLGPRAFPPKRPAHVPTAEEWLDISHQGDDDMDAPFWISAAAPAPWSLAGLMAAWDGVVADMLSDWGQNPWPI